MYIVVIALFWYVIFEVFLSSFGYFSDIETNSKAIFQFAICLTVALIVAVLLASFLKTITKGIVGGIAGFFLGFLIYNLIFAMFINSNSILLWIIILVSTAAGTVFMVHFKEEKEPHMLALIVIGAYMIIRGLSIFFGGFPDEVQTFSQLS